MDRRVLLRGGGAAGASDEARGASAVGAEEEERGRSSGVLLVAHRSEQLKQPQDALADTVLPAVQVDVEWNLDTTGNWCVALSLAFGATPLRRLRVPDRTSSWRRSATARPRWRGG